MQLHRQRCEAEPAGRKSAAAAEMVRRWRKALAAFGSRMLWWTGTRRRLEVECAALRADVVSLGARLRRLEERECAPLARPGAMSLNLTNKALALKLARTGQAVRQIAGALGVPAGEIELLLKVQRLESGLPPVRAAAPPRTVANPGLQLVN